MLQGVPCRPATICTASSIAGIPFDVVSVSTAVDLAGQLRKPDGTGRYSAIFAFPAVDIQAALAQPQAQALEGESSGGSGGSSGSAGSSRGSNVRHSCGCHTHLLQQGLVLCTTTILARHSPQPGEAACVFAGVAVCTSICGLCKVLNVSKTLS
jgi:hypothetical protein